MKSNFLGTPINHEAWGERWFFRRRRGGELMFCTTSGSEWEWRSAERALHLLQESISFLTDGNADYRSPTCEFLYPPPPPVIWFLCERRGLLDAKQDGLRRRDHKSHVRGGCWMCGIIKDDELITNGFTTEAGPPVMVDERNAAPFIILTGCRSVRMKRRREQKKERTWLYLLRVKCLTWWSS